jgi:hypothetical protein
MTGWYGTGPASSGTIMNPLALIKQQLEKAARLREAQMASPRLPWRCLRAQASLVLTGRCGKLIEADTLFKTSWRLLAI